MRLAVCAADEKKNEVAGLHEEVQDVVPGLLLIVTLLPAKEAVDWPALTQKPYANRPVPDLGLRPLLETPDGKKIPTREEWERAAKALRDTWLGHLGRPPQKPAALDVRVEKTEKQDGYTRQLLSFAAEGDDRIRAYLLVPDGLAQGEKRPAVVVFHETTRDTLNQPVGLGGKADLALALHLTRRGYVTLSPECYILKDPKGWAAGQAAALALRRPGWTGMGKMTFDASRCVDFLETVPAVDRGRVGCIGFSLGAKEVLYAMAFEPRYRAGVFNEGGIGLRMSNWTDPWYLTAKMKEHVPSSEHHQVLALAAPRPLLLLGGDSADGDASWPFVRAALPVYELYGARDRIGLVNHKGKHSFPPGARSIAYRWLDHWLEHTPARDEIGAGAAQAGRPPARLPRDNLLVYRGPDGKPAPVKTAEDWAKRRAEILHGAESVMGKLPGDTKRCALDMKVEEEVDCGAFVRRLVSYASEPGGRVPAYLLIPKAVLAGERKAPAVLCLHGTDNVVGHGTVVGLGTRPNRAYAAELARRGYVTLAPSYPLLAKYQPDLKRLGWESGTLKAVWDNMRGLDLLASLPFVDGSRGFGTIGHSLGGHNSVYTALFDDRLRVVVSSCGLDSYLDYHGGDPKNWEPEKGWCQTRYMRRLADYKGRLADIPFDFHEVVGALAPRHVLILAPTKDTNFRADSVDRIAAAAAPVFKLLGHEGRLRVEHPECGHDFPPEMRELAYQLFDRVLAGK